MKNKLLIILLALVFISSHSDLFSASGLNDRFQYGIFGNYLYVNQDAKFKQLPDIFSCSPGFEKGSGLGLSGGFLFEIPFGKYFFLGIRAGYSYIYSKTTASELFPYQFGNNIMQGRIIHSNEINLHNLLGEAHLSFRPFGGMIISAGATGYFPFYSAFSQKEELDKPSDFGAFENGRRTRNEYYNIKLNNVNMPILFAKGTLSYEILLNSNGTVRLAPEVAYLYPLNSLIKDFDWKLSAIAAGASLKFSSKPSNPLIIDITSNDEIKSADFLSCDTNFHSIFPNEIELFGSIYAPAGIKYWELKLERNNELLYFQRDTIAPPKSFIIPRFRLYENSSSNDPIKYKFSVMDNEKQKAEKEGKLLINKNDVQLFSSLTPYGIDENGKKVSENNIKIERKILTEVHPLLNYVFFEENSDSIPLRYNKLRTYETMRFGTEYYKNLDVIGIYRHILNIIGKRLSDNLSARINLRGYVSDHPSEINNLDLANRRANQVKNYLKDVWGIADSRINVETNQNIVSGLPPSPSYPGTENHTVESNQENQRVEITTSPDFSYILDPVTISDTISFINPTKFVFKPKIESSGQDYKWNLDIGLNGKLLQEVTISNKDADSVIIDLTSKKSDLIKKDGNLSYFYFLKDIYGLQCYKEGKIELDITEADSSMNKYSLILFDYESYNIGAGNNQMIDLMRSAFQDNSSITITGYTDVLGDSNSNLILSKNRALQTTRLLLKDNSLQPDSKYPINNFATDLVISNKYYNNISFNKSISDFEITVRGVGEAQPQLYDNSTPEGRFYSRTVTISIIYKNKDK